MRDIYLSHNLRDSGGRRTRIERRRFSYAEHIPERRSGEDRRGSDERRCGEDRRSGEDRRASKRFGIVPRERRGRSKRRSGDTAVTSSPLS
jgi:hypothetical protein